MGNLKVQDSADTEFWKLIEDGDSAQFDAICIHYYQRANDLGRRNDSLTSYIESLRKLFDYVIQWIGECQQSYGRIPHKGVLLMWETTEKKHGVVVEIRILKDGGDIASYTFEAHEDTFSRVADNPSFRLHYAKYERVVLHSLVSFPVEMGWVRELREYAEAVKTAHKAYLAFKYSEAKLRRNVENYPYHVEGFNDE